MARIFDRSADVLVAESIGRTRYRTPEGYLYCEGVRLASTKDLLYRADEIPEVQAIDGVVVMLRPPEVLFSDEAIASYQGKDITLTHPDELLTPVTWQGATVGTILNPRRGDGVEEDYLLVDFLIKDQSAIDAVEKRRLREVSAGYDADREQVKPGVGRFTRIIGNHAALVDQGRCGPACAIGDANMAKRTIWDRLREAFNTKDAAAFEREVAAAMDSDEGGEEGGKHHVVVNVNGAPAATPAPAGEGGGAGDDDPLAAIAKSLDGLTSKFTDFETRLTKLETPAAGNGDEGKGEGEGETEEEQKAREEKERAEADSKKSMDAATVPVVRSEFQSVVSKAEILAPGLTLPSFDAKASKKTMADAMCGLRRRALEKAFGDEKRKEFVIKIAGDSPDFAGMSCDHATVIFNAATELARVAVNAGHGSFDRTGKDGPMTAAKLQEINEAARKSAKRA